VECYGCGSPGHLKRECRISVLLDTDSDVTLVNRQVARKYKWKVESCELQSIAACNGEKLLVDGVTRTDTSEL